jgi:hypothetical protein
LKLLSAGALSHFRETHNMSCGTFWQIDRGNLNGIGFLFIILFSLFFIVSKGILYLIRFLKGSSCLGEKNLIVLKDLTEGLWEQYIKNKTRSITKLAVTLV